MVPMNFQNLPVEVPLLVKVLHYGDAAGNRIQIKEDEDSGEKGKKDI